MPKNILNNCNRGTLFFLLAILCWFTTIYLGFFITSLLFIIPLMIGIILTASMFKLSVYYSDLESPKKKISRRSSAPKKRRNK